MWTNKIRISILAASLLLTSTLHASAPDIPDLGASTPKALLESMVKAYADKSNPQAWLGFEPPANHDLAQKILESAALLRDKTTTVAQLVQSKIGKMEADMIRQTTGNGVQPGVEVTLANQITVAIAPPPDNKINWDQTKIIENGNSARIPNTYGPDLLMTKVNGKWYLDEDHSPTGETLAIDAPDNKKATDQLLTLLDQLQQKLNAGTLTKDNFMTEYSNLINAAFTPK